MLSALISSAHGYAAMPLTRQLPHQKCVIPGPLVLMNEPLKSPAPTVDKDRTVSRRSEPSSRTALTGEQPDPWDLLQPQDATSRHRAYSAVTGGADYLFTLLLGARGRRIVATLDFAFASDHHLGPKASVVTGSSSEELTSHGITLDRNR